MTTDSRSGDSHQVSAKMNRSASVSTSSPNYCILPSQHSHSLASTNSLLDILADEDAFLAALAEHNQTAQLGEELSSQQSINGQLSSQLLDPYIDAVQVRGRLNNRRGARVKAAEIEPHPSYYSKTVHVEESKELDDHDWDSDSDDDDEHDEHHYHHQHEHHHKKKKPKKKVKLYVKKKKPKKVHGKQHHYKKRPAHYRAAKKYQPKKKKKVAYAYLYKPQSGGKHNHYDHHHDHHQDHYSAGGHYEHQPKHKSGHSKLAHFDHHQVIERGKMSVAGLLGYTLLCVNYLLVMQQPSYDKYDDHYYTKYSPHSSSKSEMVKLKSSGPVLLAHCSELPAQKDLVGLAATTNRSLDTQSSSYYATTGHYQSDEHDDHQNYELHYVRRHSPASSPPAYYYTLGPSSGYSRANDRSLFSPIQSYLNRLLLPTSLSDHYSDDDHRAAIQVVSGPPTIAGARQAARLEQSGGGQLAGRRQVAARLQKAAKGARRVVVLDGQPQVVRTQDNLAELRARPVQVSMHVVRQRFSGPQQGLNLPEEPDWSPGGRGSTNGLGVQVPLAVRAPSFDRDQPQADEPRRDDNSNNRSSPLSGNNLQLDLPEYALSGDSIELTCNHGMSPARLYSVKWFKDSLEFYRFIPANGPRTKSALFLPDVRTDLARSNSQLLYLRNVTHRTSGLYRCEVVSGKWSSTSDVCLCVINSHFSLSRLAS